MYMETGKTKDAIDALKKSLACSPNEIAYLGLGDMAFSSGDYKAALLNYGKAKDISPKSDLAWRNLGDTYSVLENPAKMMECYRNAANILAEKLNINPSNGVDWMTLAFYHAKVGDSSSAWEDLRQADLHGAADVESQFTKAQALAVLGKKEEAIKLVIACMGKGLNPLEIRLALDLRDVRLDPRYKSAEAKLRSQGPT
jgi:tetratricopeptide (TPR) repeat protein